MIQPEPEAPAPCEVNVIIGDRPLDRGDIALLAIMALGMAAMLAANYMRWWEFAVLGGLWVVYMRRGTVMHRRWLRGQG